VAESPVLARRGERWTKLRVSELTTRVRTGRVLIGRGVVPRLVAILTKVGYPRRHDRLKLLYGCRRRGDNSTRMLLSDFWSITNEA